MIEGTGPSRGSLKGIESNALPGWPRNSVKVTERTRGRIGAGAGGTAETRDTDSKIIPMSVIDVRYTSEDKVCI